MNNEKQIWYKCLNIKYNRKKSIDIVSSMCYYKCRLKDTGFKKSFSLNKNIFCLYGKGEMKNGKSNAQ